MKIRHTSLLALAGLIAVAGQAQAQYAIGQGNALDRNMRRGDTRVNPAGRDYTAELRFRDAIVTGNAAGGLSFRGDVGYTAASDFRGLVGGDTTYGFRRDSVISGLAGLGVRGTDALQYQYALTTGNQRPSQFSGLFSTSRFGGTTGDPTTRTPSLRAESAESAEVLSRVPEIDLDRGSSAPVRSTSAYTTTKSYLPTLVTAFGTPEGRAIAQTASPLRGIETIDIGRVQDIRPDLVPQGLRSAQGAEDTQEEQTRPGGVPTVRDEAGLNFNQELMRRYDAYLNWQEGSGEDTKGKKGWRDNLTSIRDFLNTPPADLSQYVPQEDEGEETDPLRPELPGGRPGEEQGIPGLNDNMIDLIRQGPGRVESLLLTDPDQVDAYGAHVKAGEKLLTEGRYFDAEDRFTKALSHKAGDTFAASGRIHAEIGAGMYVTAALNLRNLLREHPEAAGVRYGESLLPKPARLRLVISELRKKIESERIEADAALLLAYIGYQTRDRDLLAEGLDELDEHSIDGPLGRFVRQIWQEK